MLKRLELVGFKSFAEKTRFDFAPGVTAIVGPNGSGKSNVVDAVRWILGEQSAKSLRGGEMADVIFNGSSSRRSLGMAEVTMTFDNARGQLAVEAAEVQITRRVYRDGEGEYLINNQPSRLKDIKDLFLGSGAGTSALCIIEQGRVDALLQASTRERRAIFEEAAGISRFKAKKVETLRKLERVEENLIRLRDIMAEVDKQLKSVRLQASKAQRYQEYTARLRELRVGLGLQEYGRLTRELEAERAAADALRAGLTESGREADAWQTQADQFDADLTRLDEEVRSREARLGFARQRIASHSATAEHERALSDELEAELARVRQRRGELAARLIALDASFAQSQERLQAAASEAKAREAESDGCERAAEALAAELDRLRRRLQEGREELVERRSDAARRHNAALDVRQRLDQARRDRERVRAEGEQAAEHLASLDEELTTLADEEGDLQTRLAAARGDRQAHVERRDGLRREAESVQQQLADLRADQKGLANRIEVLEGLERSREGLGTGVREVADLLESATAGGLADAVVGLVADLITVPREVAPLIDLALGDKAQRFVVRSNESLDDALAALIVPFAGRVSFSPPRPGDEAVPEGEAFGAVRADRLVTCDRPDLAGLPAQLLGDSWLVRDLAAARAWAARLADAGRGGFRILTQAGELLEADGTLTVGAHHAEAGILSRKSELRELRLDAERVAGQVAASERAFADLHSAAAGLDGPIQTLEREITQLADRAGRLREWISERRGRRGDLHERVTLSRSEIAALEENIVWLEQDWSEAQGRSAEAEQAAAGLERANDETAAMIRDRERDQSAAQQALTAAKVALETVRERLAGLRAAFGQVEADRAERRAEAHELDEAESATAARWQASQLAVLRATAALADAFADKDRAERAIAHLSAERESTRSQRRDLLARLESVRGAWEQQRAEVHARELSANTLESARKAIADRLREDYQVDLEELRVRSSEFGVQNVPDGATSPTGEAPSELRTPNSELRTDEEIARLQRQVRSLGSVNLEALAELAEVEARATEMQAQIDDLTSAQKSLQEIIDKINADSRALFTETFATIRANFQDLFRKLFAGGMADVLLEDEADVLDSGIEINARPPGKELRSISLMSGGEKTMTAVALLLAIFRSKPSPFCLLDEVDAALDEGNTSRLASVLREFLDRSQFIIITHKKRTMAAADVLYGITMQESGVSKQVSVKFEDWEDEPQATQAA